MKLLIISLASVAVVAALGCDRREIVHVVEVPASTSNDLDPANSDPPGEDDVVPTLDVPPIFEAPEGGAPEPHDEETAHDDDDDEERDKTDTLGAGTLADHCVMPASCCGFPGDVGNELGVGKFCVTDSDCAGNGKAVVCSSIENGLTDHNTYYCSFLCDVNGPPDQCGSGASCRCEEPFGCGCGPSVCWEQPFPGCTEA